MKFIGILILLVSTSSLAALSNPEKSAGELCEMEWRITDRSASTKKNVQQIVNEEVKTFKSDGRLLSDYSIDEKDFIKVSIEGGIGFRRMVGKMTTPYSEARDFFRERMMPPCIKNVLHNLSKNP
ncbi:hypothetical protein [Erwinia tasmaniensis]|uniref:hypothetical protein n=1 Tax=Erwinia tasmaniensis TaxID=338565 RepID=UPI003A4DBC92